MSAVTSESLVGTELPTLVIELTPTFVISTAIASRDFEDVHHDVEAARRAGLDNVILNILTTSGLCQQYVTDWAGPQTIIEKASVRLGLPAIAGGRLTLTGTVESVAPADDDRQRLEIAVAAAVSKGSHANATVTCTIPTSSSGHQADLSIGEAPA